jgi:hypothetical protein
MIVPVCHALTGEVHRIELADGALVEELRSCLKVICPLMQHIFFIPAHSSAFAASSKSHPGTALESHLMYPCDPPKPVSRSASITSSFLCARGKISVRLLFLFFRTHDTHVVVDTKSHTRVGSKSRGSP